MSDLAPLDDKDTLKSCIFEYPDRPVDSLPPQPPGPIPYPYEPPKDWPNVDPRPIPGSEPFVPPPVDGNGNPTVPNPIYPPDVLRMNVFNIYTPAGSNHYYGPWDGDLLEVYTVPIGPPQFLRAVDIPNHIPFVFHGIKVGRMDQYPPSPDTTWPTYLHNDAYITSGGYPTYHKGPYAPAS